MTLIAGFFSRGPEHRVPNSVRETLRRIVSRNAGDEVRVFEDQRSFFVKVDIGAYGEDAFYEGADNNLSLLAGEPLLALEDDEDGEAWQSRTRDLERLHDSWSNGDESLIRRARGVFCAAHYKRDDGTLTLVTDKLGIRPMYYWVGEPYVAFATALRVLEGLAEVPKVMNLRAVTEMVCLGAPLADRTPYATISLLKPAEIVRISGKGVARRRYWRWDEISESAEPESNLLRETYESFSRSVGRRLRKDRTTVAFLSGGMDSRCVVAALRGRGVRVHTFNFASRGTQDQVFGREFARQAGTIHEEVPMRLNYPDWSQIMADTWGASKHRTEWPAERPNLVWSGAGGSVCLGHVHLTPKVIGLLRAGKRDDAIEEFLLGEATQLPRRLIRDDTFSTLSQSLRQGINEELDGIQADDPGRSLHIFLMLNDQHRHLTGHFENLDLHRLEYQLPFMDSDFLAKVLTIPVDLSLNHKFYTKWMKLFPDFAMAAPWQTYPGHEPCPLPAPEGLLYQWNDNQSAEERESRKQELLKQASTIMRTGHFPKSLNRRNLYLATLMYRMGVRDYGYLIEAARLYHKYSTASGGSYTLPPPPVATE